MKSTLKRIVRWIAALAILPLFISHHIRARIFGRDLALESSSQTLSLFPGLSGAYLRTAFLQRALAECHPSARIDFGVLFSKSNARIEENVYIGPRCCIGLAHLERDVLIAPGVHIPSGGTIHGVDDPTRPIREQPGELTLVRIGAGTWIGSNAVVMANVGRNCVIGAGAVVTRPIPDSSVAVGVPARVIRSRLVKPPTEADPNRELASGDGRNEL